MMVAMDTTTEVRTFVQLQQGNICNSHEERITTGRSLRNNNRANSTAGQVSQNGQSDLVDQQHPMDIVATATAAPPARAFRKTPFSMSLDQQEVSGNIGSNQPFSLNVPLIEIEEFVETTIVLKKDKKKNELGISIVGGSDTYLETICVSAVHPDGTAFKDGRLKRGDILLAVNDRSLRDVTSSEALVVMREACSPVRLVVLRENPLLMFTTSDEPTKYVTVELRKAAVTDRLGLSIMHGDRYGQGVFVTWVRPGSIAARQGRILQGDRILEINGQNVRESSQRELASTIQNLDGAIVILLGRVPTLTHSIQEWTRMKVGSPGRIRTSTWSYTAKEKLQSQRPSLPVSTGKENHELLVPVPIPFPIPRPQSRAGSSKRFGSLSSDTGSPHRSGIVHSMRMTLGEGANLPLVLPLKIDEELLCAELRSPLREKRLINCPKIEVTNC